MKAAYNLSLPLAFLKKIKKNNDRTWFTTHKADYEKAFGELIVFADLVLTDLKKQDDIETPSGKKSLFRIYNDVRFSKDKSPYKLNLGGGFRRATALRRGGYYFHIQPGNSFVAGGFWGPSTPDLSHIRQQIAADPEPLTGILRSKSFKKTFGTLQGEQLKTAPRGYTADHPAIDLLRCKQLIVRHDFSDEEVMHPSFHKKVAQTFHDMRPFLDYMSEILTTDLNGIPLHQ
ncbi:MAG: hypothetical protein JWM14_658 [Chitinophagaceae bacterium]|nr:hypothetical protein [Chitinophagaceae bacterium]